MQLASSVVLHSSDVMVKHDVRYLHLYMACLVKSHFPVFRVARLQAAYGVCELRSFAS